ncbi:MAG: hypothetical protein ACKO38_18785 [Planctomycetota bacterium]
MVWRELSAVFPELATERVAQWVGKCRVHVPNAIPSGRRWSLISSRLPRALDEHPEWFQRLRAACDELRASGGIVVAVDGTAACRFVCHAAERFSLPLLFLRLGTETTSGATSNHSELLAQTGPAEVELAEANDDDDEPSFQEIPLRDRLLWLLGQEIRVLAARRAGTVERLIAYQQRESPAWQPVRLDRIATHETWTPPKPSAVTAIEAARPSSTPAPILDTATTLPWPALWHATRRHEGPWTGQTESEFLDELLFERPERDRSEAATLRRILEDGRLRASPLAIRGGFAAVCFSAAPLDQRSSLRTFRAHRGRWDAEPFGIAVRTETLVARGARPVIYGDESTWNNLAEPDRPWFQRHSTRSGKTPIDWSREQEWRLLGDLPLDELPPADVRVFVPDASMATRIAAVSRWPVIVLKSAASPPEDQTPDRIKRS